MFECASRYNPRKEKKQPIMRPLRMIVAVAALAAWNGWCGSARAQDEMKAPAADLAGQIASMVGRGTARLMIRNLSSEPVDEIPAIRKLLEQELRGYGVIANGAPNETVIRVTLSENARGRTWVAEVIRGDETQVAVVELPAGAANQTSTQTQFVLRSDRLITSKVDVLGAIETATGLVLLTPTTIVVEAREGSGWGEPQILPMSLTASPARDARGVLVADGTGGGFDAFIAGTHCTGIQGQTHGTFEMNCGASDDPWPIGNAPATTTAQPSGSGENTQASVPSATKVRASFNGARNYFTGVVAPSVGVGLPPFYSGAVVAGAQGEALVIGGIDGKVMVASNGKLATVRGADDWGSDFALLRSGCGDGTQIVASGMGDTGAGSAPTDSLRAFEIVNANAEARSAPLTIDGTVTAIQTAIDGKSVLAVIRNAQNEFEVDRVTALCD